MHFRFCKTESLRVASRQNLTCGISHIILMEVDAGTVESTRQLLGEQTICQGLDNMLWQLRG